jgi:hypothetical protein
MQNAMNDFLLIRVAVIKLTSILEKGKYFNMAFYAFPANIY